MKGRNILIVEDENIVALDMRMRLDAMGYRVVDVVDTGTLAIDRVTALDPDLVLMDIKLKGEQDGIEIATQLRERSEVPVIFVTAFTDERTLDRAKRASPYGYIVKPFHERELRIAIELALYKHQYELSIRRERDIAEESNRIKGEFLTNMSHELKTPLNSVIGFTELAMASSKDPEQREHLAIALSSAKSLLMLIESILDFARMEAGKLAVVESPFSLDALLDDCTDALAMATYSKGLAAFSYRDPSIPDSLIGDSSMLRHILLNLIDNAVKFTDAGSVHFSSRLLAPKAGSDSSVSVEFEVVDTGIGMPPEKIDVAFDRFTQLDASKTRRAGGTGLGLAIVSKSVELMGGELSVESEEGKGTRFFVRISFELGSDARWADAPSGADHVEAVLAGFDDETGRDAAAVLSRLGLSSTIVAGLREAAGMESAIVLADERALEAGPQAIDSSLEGRLIVATRLGGAARSRLGGNPVVAFSALPLRASGFSKALGALRGSDLMARRSGSLPSSNASVTRFGSPPLSGDTGKVSSSATGDEVALRISHEASAAADDEAAAVLLRLASILGTAVSSAAYSDAEREAKEAQGRLDRMGEARGSRLAFAALLAARKGDSETLAGSIAAIEKFCGSRVGNGLGGLGI